jgi:hypothetical protein
MEMINFAPVAPVLFLAIGIGIRLAMILLAEREV